MKVLKSNEPVEMMTTINTLKATMKKRDEIIQEQKAQLDVLQNLLDEAREEMGQDDQSEKSEKPTYGDALEILDSIISKPLGISSTSKGQEFNQILKRTQLIREQTEEPILKKIVVFMVDYLPSVFKDQEKHCENVNDLKQVFLDSLITLKDEHKSLNASSNEALDVSTDSKNMRRPYGFKDAYIDILYILDQFNETYKVLIQAEHDKDLDTKVKELQSKYNNDLNNLGNEYIEKFQKERMDLISQLQAEKQSEIKTKEAAIIKDYDSRRQQMYEQFETLKKEFQDQFSKQSKKYQDVSEHDNEKLRKEIEKQKETYEEEYNTKLQKKTNMLEGMFKNRKDELEDEYNLKIQGLEFELKSKAESEEGKNKAELEQIIQKYEKQSTEKIKRIQNECDIKIQEIQENLETKSAELKKAKAEYDRKAKDHKKIMERELKFKSETQERDCKSKYERDLKKHHEQTEDLHLKIKEMEEKIPEEKKSYKELLKSNREKQKAEIRNIKNNHENELIRKRIETEKEIKDVKRDLETELENTKKEFELLMAEKLLTQKRDFNESHQKKMKLEKIRNEKVIVEKETEMNMVFNGKEIEMIQKHEEEIQVLKTTLTEQNEKILIKEAENIKLEFEDRFRSDMDNELQCVTERIKNQYQTENETLKLKLQEINDTQSLVTMENGDDNMTVKEDESVHSENFLYPIHASELKRIKKVTTAFDYQRRERCDNKAGSDDEEAPRRPPTARSMMTAQNEKEMIGILHAKNEQDMNILQHKYELRITQLLEDHMNEIQESKSVTLISTVKKIERILILELEKMCQAIS